MTLIRRSELLRMIPLGRTQLAAAIGAGEFPPPIKITEGGRRIAWVREEVDAWIEERKAARRQASRDAV
jgi:prophage regulatory protein